MRVEDEYIGGETCVKFEGIGAHWVCLMSGSLNNAHRLVGIYRTILNDTNLKISPDNVVDVMSTAPRQLLSRLSEELIHDELRMTVEDFHRYGKKALGQTYLDLRQRIKEIRIDCQLIIGGFLNGQTHLLQVDEDGSVKWREHYALIGSGTYEAHSMLQERGYVRTVELMDAIYLSYEAKRWSEKSRGLVTAIPLSWSFAPFRGGGINIGWVDPLVGIPFLDEAFGRFNLQPVTLGNVMLPTGFFRVSG